jgi:hypothetical protein
VTFRTPLTAADVDTRPGPAAAGVTINGSTATWWDGNRTAGKVYLTSSALHIQGPDTGLELVLSLDSLPAGGTRPAARLTGATRGLEPILGPSALVFPAPTLFDAYDPTGNVWADPRAWQTADGMVHVRGMVVAKTAGLWGAGQVIHSLPAGIPGPGDTIPLEVLGFNNRFVRCDLQADGRLLYSAAVSPDVTFAAGAFLALRYDYLPL